MNFFLDHDVPIELGRMLRLKGHRVEILSEHLDKTAEDLEVLRYAREKELIVITCNRDDFLRLAQTQSYAGIIILVRRKSRVAECAGLLRLLDRAGESGIAKNVNFA